MKLIATALLLILATSVASAQSLLNRAQSAASSQGVTAPSVSSLPSLSNITGAKDAIMGKLTPALGLTAAEKPAVSTDITGFLKDKAAILPLLNTDKPAYETKLSGLQSGLFGKLKTALTAAQYAKLLGLKPAAPSATNVLSSLFF
jgi:prophage DNA circulation protein